MGYTSFRGSLYYTHRTGAPLTAYIPMPKGRGFTPPLVKKAPLALQPLCFFSPRCTAANDYAALCDEMLARMESCK